MSKDFTDAKRGQSASAVLQAANDEIVPLIIASLPPTTFDFKAFKAMSALDPQERTPSTFEHKFRKWKVQAGELKSMLEASLGGDAEKVEEMMATGNATKKPKPMKSSPVKANHGTNMIADHGAVNLENEDAPVARPTTGRKGPAKAPVFAVDGAVGLDNEDAPVARPTTGRKGPVKAPVFAVEPTIHQDDTAEDSEDTAVKKANATKKRGTKATEIVVTGSKGPVKAPVFAAEPTIHQDDTAEDSEDTAVKKDNVTKKRGTKAAEIVVTGSPAKKPKVVKKGIAKVLKKETFTEYDETSEEKEEPKPAIKPKKVKTATRPRAKPKAKVQKVQAEVAIKDDETQEDYEMEFE